MAWAGKSAGVTQGAIDNATEEFLESVTLTPGETIHVQITADNEDAATVTDNLIVSVYTTLDDAAEDWDEIPFMQFEIEPSVVTEVEASFSVSGVYRFRVGVLSSGATDTYTAKMYHQADQVSL